MLTSNYNDVLSKAYKVVYILLLSALGLVWLNQQSLSLYWQQQFHRESPWSRVESPIWTSGGRLTSAFVAAKQAFVATLSGETNSATAENTGDDQQPTGAEKSPVLASNQADCEWNTPELREKLLYKIPTFLKITSITTDVGSGTMVESGIITTEPEAKVDNTNRIIPGQPIHLKPENQVLFVGDSMMQGVAPYVMKTLATAYEVKSINLSKQSTGLAYPGFFNWPRTIADTLEKNPDISLIVIFLGPNDPWDMPPNKGARFYKFMSAEWEQLYRSRIEDILSQARARNINVIWVGPPNMRKQALSDGIRYLNGLYKSEVALAEQLYIPVNDIFEYHDGAYSDYLEVGNSKVKLRSDDGTHFTPTGQKMIAERILSFVSVDKTAKEETKIAENK
ncbi:SGNH/GDSL hydrolase family protein [Budvicia diplopodorum]|uniref:SGNH/GDSL hydrolase family protein n=1 Tax=Budvicia diplopodorum TaxID=1119056 RepID=UPI00135699CA|nr:SGNH family hydrolase [Budvicia diplopodorum]